MKLFLILIFLPFILIASESVGFGSKTPDNKKEQSRAYTIQLFSTKDLDYAKKLFKKTPTDLQNQTHLYRVDGFIKCRYSQTPFYSKIKPFIKKFEKAGFKNAYVVETTSLKMKNELIENKTSVSHLNKNKASPAKSSIKKSTKPKTPKISNFLNSDIVSKANSAYKNGNDIQAMLYYEMLLASGNKNQKIKNNLCYLYGKRGAWLQAQELIDKEKYINDLLYAYAYGAVETNQKDFYQNLSQYIMMDKSARLSLLSGYYFERQNKMQRAFEFYKMAYEKNPSDVYTVFSYARAEDIAQNHKKAVSLYRDILRKIDDSNPLYDSIKKRLNQLGE